MILYNSSPLTLNDPEIISKLSDLVKLEYLPALIQRVLKYWVLILQKTLFTYKG